MVDNINFWLALAMHFFQRQFSHAA